MKKIFISHGLPVFLVGGAAVLYWALGQAFGAKVPYLPFYPAVVFSALVGGVVPGLLATALSGLIVAYFFLPPIGSLYIEDLGDTVGMGIFSCTGILISLITSYLQTARIKAESTRPTAKDLYRCEPVASQNREIILFINDDGGAILEANFVAENVYGYTREELLKLSIHDLCVGDTQLLKTGQVAEADAQDGLFETVHRRKDGSIFPVEVSSWGTTIGGTRTLISAVRDISARKQAEQALENPMTSEDHEERKDRRP